MFSLRVSENVSVSVLSYMMCNDMDKLESARILCFGFIFPKQDANATVFWIRLSD